MQTPTQRLGPGRFLRCEVSGHPLTFIALFVAALTGCSTQPATPVATEQPQEEPGGADTKNRSPAIEQLDLAALEARVSELETQLRDRGVTPLADVETMMDLLDRHDGAKLSHEFERLLLLGPKGHAVLFDFFHACDLDRPKMLKLTHHPQTVLAMLQVITGHPDEVVKLVYDLLDRTAEIPESFIRREMFNFVPVLLAHHEGKYPKLAERLKEEIELQLRSGGEWMYKTMLAAEILEYEPPVDAFEGILGDLEKRAFHAMIIDHLSGRGADGLEAIYRYVDATPPEGSPAVGRALTKIATLEGTSDRFARYLHDDRSSVRLAALTIYFREERAGSDVELARDFLESEAPKGMKRALLRVLRRANAALVASLVEARDNLTHAEAREILDAEAKRAARKTRNAG